jgi:bla regulator protein blaR1
MRMRLAAAASVAAALLAGAQAQSFEVVSIHPNRSGGADSNLDSLPSGRMAATNITVRELVRLAYGVKDYQIEHAPGWMDTERYDIAATGAPGSKKLEDERARVRALLEDRFQLRTHRETKPGRVYLLTVDQHGLKLTPHNDGAGTRTRKGCGHLAGSRVTVDVIATMLSRETERDVLNRTGLAGKFDFQLDWAPDTRPCPAEDDAPVRPSFYTAVQQQLGLKLDAARGPVDVLVIDRLERPSEN